MVNYTECNIQAYTEHLTESHSTLQTVQYGH